MKDRHGLSGRGSAPGIGPGRRFPHPWRIGLVMLWLAVAGGREAAGQEQSDDGQPLGTVEFPTSCTEAARLRFPRAVALLHHMTYPEARKEFMRIAELDPGCAMAHWGIAMTLFQPLWPTRPGPDDLREGAGSRPAGRSLSRTVRESLYVEAVGGFFREPGEGDYWARIRRWAAGSETLHLNVPDDPDATAFYAEALLAVAPVDTAPSADLDLATALLRSVYRQNPDHPGAMHYMIHASDADGRAEQAPDIVRRYALVAPRNPHALHMPTHIYTRLGRWNEVIDGNLRAASAALEHPAGDHGEFVWDEFPHAIEYLTYAYLQQGADVEAAHQIQRLETTGNLQPSFKTAFHLASTRARYVLERGDWSAAAALVPRSPSSLDWDRFPWPEGVTWFARGLGAARLGRLEGARSAVRRLGELEQAARSQGEDLFASNIMILRLEVEAWLAQGADAEAAVRLMQQAVELESRTPKHAVTPAPTLPAGELLGDLFMAQSRYREALEAYRQSLNRYPRRFNGLLGAARAARATGHDGTALSCYRTLLEVAAPGGGRPALEEARAFLARGGAKASGPEEEV